jgi:hypothetical protein
MRRPSWNKSQAIQQVISLKALLEPTDDDLPAPVGVSSAIHHHHHHHPQPPQVSFSLSVTFSPLFVWFLSLIVVT